MKKTWTLGLPLAAAAMLALIGCGRKDKHDGGGDTPAAATEDGADGSDPGPTSTPVKPEGKNGDEIPNDGSGLGLRDGELYVANLLNAAQISRTDLGDKNIQDEVYKLVPNLPKPSAGIATMTNAHIVNASKIAFRVCDAWLKKAKDGGDARFAENLPWGDGDHADNVLVMTSLAPVFQAAFWGPDTSLQPSQGDIGAVLGVFNDGLGQPGTDPTNGNPTQPLNFFDSAVANCIVYAVASPAWFL